MQEAVIIEPVIIKACGGPKDMCKLSYYKHPNGCPNYGKKKGCPPHTRFFDEIYDLSESVYALYNIFDLKSHVMRMRDKHPEWSQRQLECCLYWQGTARKELREFIKGWLKNHREYTIEATPEGLGVNITNTLHNIGIELEWPPISTAYQVALAGVSK